ncbi:MAG: hypothetical protein JW797_00720 [Bradymonadales bacterium]|nr:hypothetical protein [Bradymonadales bacterium]
MRLNLTNNLTLKIISVVIGLVLYLFVMQERENQKVIKYTVQIEPPDEYMLLSEVPEISVTITGRNRHLRQQEEHQTIVLTLSRAVTHKTFEHRDFPLPSGLEVRDITPQTIRLDFARLISREIPISINYTGQPAPGYSVTATSVTPPTIRLEGPENEIQNLQYILTQSVDLTGASQSITNRRVYLVSPGRSISFDTGVDVRVTLAIEQDEATLAVDSIPVTISGPSERFSVDIAFVSVTLRGPRSGLEQIDTSPLRASVDATPYLDYPPGTYDVRPMLINLTEGIWAENMTPSTVRLTIEERPALQYRTIPFINLLPFPLPANWIVSPVNGEPAAEEGD